jgi:predicted Rossmann fold nucleotide-binding protein DprA/Smf involved in DNA uptake
MEACRRAGEAAAAAGLLVVTGGAAGADRAAMEGALGLPGNSLAGAVPLTSRNADRVARSLGELSGLRVRLDRGECELRAGPLVVLYPDFRGGYHPGRYLERDRRVAGRADLLVAFWDGESPGTAKTIALARSMGTPVRTLRFGAGGEGKKGHELYKPRRTDPG